MHLLRSPMSFRWAQELRRMEKSYPAFVYKPRAPHQDLIALRRTRSELVEHVDCENPVKTWRGVVRPFAGNSEADVLKIIADLAAHRPVAIDLNGELRHIVGCEHDHELPPELRPARALTESYEIAIACRRPPAHPIVRALNPRIGAEAEASQTHELVREPHLFPTLSALCVLMPSDDVWNWDRGDGISDYADQSAFYCAKHAFWKESRERLGAARGIWLGEATEHDEFSAFERVIDISDDAPCYCGRDRQYAECCRAMDAAIVRSLVGAIVRVPFLVQHRVGSTRFHPQVRKHVLPFVLQLPRAQCWCLGAQHEAARAVIR